MSETPKPQPDPAEAERKPTWSDYAGSPAGQEDYALWGRHAALDELLAAAEELCDDLDGDGIHCERLRAAIAKYRGAK